MRIMRRDTVAFCVGTVLLLAGGMILARIPTVLMPRTVELVSTYWRRLAGEIKILFVLDSFILAWALGGAALALISRVSVCMPSPALQLASATMFLVQSVLFLVAPQMQRKPIVLVRILPDTTPFYGVDRAWKFETIMIDMWAALLCYAAFSLAIVAIALIVSALRQRALNCPGAHGASAS